MIAAAVSHSALAIEYAEAVASGSRSECQWVRLACKRFLTELKQWQGPDSPYYFDAAAADRVCGIVSRFPHIKGRWARNKEKLRLEPWQCFILCNVFGWKARDSGMRRFRIAYIEVPRKNAKSTIASAVGLYMLACDGEPGAHVVVAANTLQQARLLFNDAQHMARQEKGFQNRFGIEVFAHTVVQTQTASKFEAIAAEAGSLDGLNLHCILVDEVHAHGNRALWDVLETATGSRTQPLIWATTTAGMNRASICYELHSHLKEVLRGAVEDDVFFGMIYTRDDGDDPWLEATWRKCNPNYNISVFDSSIRPEAKRAQVMPSAQPAFLTKHCNIWVNAPSAWMPVGAWERCEDRTLYVEDFAREACYVGIDLAIRSDIAALMLAFPPVGMRDYWAVFGKFYLPEDTVNRSENTHYQGWEAAGRLVATEGNVTDFHAILGDLEDICSRFPVLEIAIDPYASGPLIVDIERAGLPKPVEVRQSAANLSPAMLEMEGLILSRRMRHDGDPVLAWMASNVKVVRSGDLMKPAKPAEDKKIDGIVALLMCVHRHMKSAPVISAGAWTMEDSE